MGRKQREIDALKLQLEEMFRTSEDLKLENAEYRAKLDMLLNAKKEEIKEEPIVEAESAEETQVEEAESEEKIENIEEEAIKEGIEVVDFTPENEFLEEEDAPKYFYDRSQNDEIDTTPFVKEDLDKEDLDKEDLDNVASFEVITDDVPQKEIIDHSEEIEELKEQNKMLFEELKAIRELLNKKEEKKVEEKPANPTIAPSIPNFAVATELNNPDVANNMGKLILDSQIGAAKIIEEAKKEALKQIEEARKEAEKIKTRVDENNHVVYRKLGVAKRDIDDIISQIESVSANISTAQSMVDKDEIYF